MRLGSLIDPFVLVPIIGLSSLSLAIIGSTNPSLFASQFIFFIIGFLLCYFFSKIDYRIYKSLLVPFYILSLLALALVFVGPNVRGATRWIDLFGFRLQSSEIIKPFIFIFFSYLLTRFSILKLKNIMLLLLTFIPVLFLIFKQPDLGNAVIFSGVFIMLLINGGLSISYLAGAFASVLILIPLLWGKLHDYQRLRILSFINPQGDPKGAGYNALQAVIAIGAGGLWGLGLGRGTQSHLLFLPEFHTDFVYASLVEELGFMGGIIVLVFYLLLLFRILQIAFKTDDPFGRLICVAVFTQILLQVFINIGMNIGILPITGITLPLLSYGGSSILSIFISLGIVFSISKKVKDAPLVIS